MVSISLWLASGWFGQSDCNRRATAEQIERISKSPPVLPGPAVAVHVLAQQRISFRTCFHQPETRQDIAGFGGFTAPHIQQVRCR